MPTVSPYLTRRLRTLQEVLVERDEPRNGHEAPVEVKERPSPAVPQVPGDARLPRENESRG
jgi:hypothetical protein